MAKEHFQNEKTLLSHTVKHLVEKCNTFDACLPMQKASAKEQLSCPVFRNLVLSCLVLSCVLLLCCFIAQPGPELSAVSRLVLVKIGPPASGSYWLSKLPSFLEVEVR